ncbi:MAG TPA: TetR family transcriptional regulator [Solirubrobacteraceae bacterium]|nr:TetR family transcriptional regulator [Solirubrobacteraceae bacterium]
MRESDLTTYARIRNAALEGFAQRGVASTGIRDVAGAAGVSPGLVQHHFGTKAGLRAAVDEYVREVVIGAFSGLIPMKAKDPIRVYGDRITELVREHPMALLYVARSLADGDEAAHSLFDTFFAFSRERWTEMAEDGRLRPDVDVDWAALHAIMWPVATVLFGPAIERNLGKPFAGEELDRWNEASRMLFGYSAYDPRRRPRT